MFLGQNRCRSRISQVKRGCLLPNRIISSKRRCNFHAYCLFSLVNTIVYCVPAHWLWESTGFLYALDVIDIAGSGGVHLVGGASAIVAAVMLGPRLGRWDLDVPPPMGSPTNALIGLFMLWW